MDQIDDILRNEDRYAPDAYLFVRQALDLTVKMLNKPQTGPHRHVSGRELLEGFRRHALHEFGPMARTVLRSWGVTSTADVGEIVFRLVESGVLGKTDKDSKQDFTDGYDFHEAFVSPYLPAQERDDTAGGGYSHVRQHRSR